MIYLELFLAFFQIGLFSIGGGYAALPLIQNQVVDAHMWLTMEQFADVITIAEMTPGPIAINAATFVGIQNFVFVCFANCYNLVSTQNASFCYVCFAKEVEKVCEFIFNSQKVFYNSEIVFALIEKIVNV